MASSSITAWEKEGEKVKAVTDFLLLAFKSLQTVTAAIKSKDDFFLAGKLDKSRQCVENQRHYSADKGPYSQAYGLSSGRVWL